MDVGTLIDAIVRQTTVLIAQLATTGGGRAQLAHTANQVFVDLVAALREQGLGSKVIADMFGLALRTYHAKLQRLGESRTVRGRTLWEAVFEHIQERGPVAKTDVLRRFKHDDNASVRSVLKDLVGSGLVYRTGRGEHVRYQVAEDASDHSAPGDRAADLVWLAVNRLAPATRADLSGSLSMEGARLEEALQELLRDGRVRKQSASDVTGDELASESAGEDTRAEQFVSDGCVLPLGEHLGWETAVFDHYQAMVSALCTKVRLGKTRAAASDLVGGSTFSYRVWPEHPHYAEATQFLADFRHSGSALRKKIADYNKTHQAPGAVASGESTEDTSVRVLVYGGQTLLGDALEEDTDNDHE